MADVRMINVTINGEIKQYPQGTTFETIAKDYQDAYDSQIACVSADGKIRELFKKVSKDCTLEFFTLKDSIGHKIYVRTATMLLFKSIFDLYGSDACQKCRVEFAIHNGHFINTNGAFPADEEHATAIKNRMKELVESRIPLMKRAYPMDEAMDIFRRFNMKDKEKLF